jgi:tetrahydromethanopterin S-methyltransferase subunit G
MSRVSKVLLKLGARVGWDNEALWGLLAALSMVLIFELIGRGYI